MEELTDFAQGAEPMFEWLKETSAIIFERITFTISACIGLLSSMLGDQSEAFAWLMVFITVDYLTGILSAVKQRDLISGQMYLGLMKKASVVGVCFLFFGMGKLIGWSGLCPMIVAAFCINEMISILENLDGAGFGNVIPDPVRNVLTKIKENQDAMLRSGRK